MSKKDETIHDTMLPPGSKFCRCSGCGEYFTSETPFGIHRVDGRCLSVTEMEARGMSKNPRGYWRSRARAA